LAEKIEIKRKQEGKKNMGQQLTKEEMEIVMDLCKDHPGARKKLEALEEMVICWRETALQTNNQSAKNQEEFHQFLKSTVFWKAFVHEILSHQPLKSKKNHKIITTNMLEEFIEDKDFSQSVADLWFDYLCEKEKRKDITLKEFLESLLILLSKDPREKARLFFHVFDTDKSGYLGRENLKTMIEFDQKYFKIGIIIGKKLVMNTYAIKKSEVLREGAEEVFEETKETFDEIYNKENTEKILDMIFHLGQLERSDRINEEEFVEFRTSLHSKYQEEFEKLSLPITEAHGITLSG